jgi:hypothetical protein
MAYLASYDIKCHAGALANCAKRPIRNLSKTTVFIIATGGVFASLVSVFIACAVRTEWSYAQSKNPNSSNAGREMQWMTRWTLGMLIVNLRVTGGDFSGLDGR